MGMDHIEGLSLIGPPRDIPMFVKLRVLLGGTISQMGWFFFGFGMIFVWVFSTQADWTSWYQFRDQLTQAQGTVTASTKTNMSEGGSKHRQGTPVYKHTYSFLVNDQRHEGTSFRTGGGRLDGQSVTIEYKTGDPNIARIQGMRNGMVSPWVGLIPLIFPAAGIAMMTGGLRKGRRGLKLLKNGLVTAGTIIDKKPTNTQINKQTVYKYTFEYITDDGQTHHVTAKTHQTQKLEDEDFESLMYDPLYPDQAVLLDELPGSPRIDATGQITAGSTAAALRATFIPALTLIGNGVFIYFKFLA